MGTAKYDRVSVLLHWLMALALTGQFLFGLALDDLAAPGSAERLANLNTHKSIGITLGLAALLRLLWRIGHHRPDWPASMTPAQGKMALWGHRSLYALMILVPLVPFVAAQYGRVALPFFGYSMAPLAADLPERVKTLYKIHEFLAGGLMLAVTGHVLVALKHAWVDEDGLLERMRF